MNRPVFAALLAFATLTALPASAQPARKPPEIVFVNLGGNDCPPCVAWRQFEFPKLQGTEVFKSITFVHVEKVIGSPVPPLVFLPPEVKPFKDKLDLASGGNSGSPQVAILVNGEVYDYYFGPRSASIIEQMLLSILNGSAYPLERCIQRATDWRCAVFRTPLPPAASTDYPLHSVVLSGDAIKERLGSKVFTVKTLASGTWRLEFKANGSVSLSTDRGYQDSGTWRVDGSTWCATFVKTGVACSELRHIDDVYYYKRASNGEVVSMTVR